jgi:hypothetical protein
MIDPARLGAVLVGVMSATAAYCASRVATGLLRARQIEYDADVMHILMGVAMAGMFASSLSFLSAGVWEAVFAVSGVWFVVRIRLEPRLGGDRRSHSDLQNPGLEIQYSDESRQLRGFSAPILSAARHRSCLKPCLTLPSACADSASEQQERRRDGKECEDDGECENCGEGAVHCGAGRMCGTCGTWGEGILDGDGELRGEVADSGGVGVQGAWFESGR